MALIQPKPMSKVGIVSVMLLMLLSATLQFVAVHDTQIDKPIRGDARDYVAYAINLKLHGVFSRTWPGGSDTAPKPDAVRGPGYPLLMAGFSSHQGNSWDLERVLYVQAAMGVLTVLCYLVLFRRFLPGGWAIAAAGLTAISPHLINSSVYLLSESLFSFLLGLHLLALDYALRKRVPRWAILAGCMLAASMLTRSTTQYLCLIYIVAWLIWPKHAGKPDLRLLAGLLIPVLLAAGGWSLRNYVQTGRTSDPLLAANFIQHGSYVNLMLDGRPETYNYAYRYDARNAEINGNLQRVTETLIERASEHPLEYLRWFLIGKPLTFFQWDLPTSVGDAFVFPPLTTPYFDHALFRVTHEIARFLHPGLMWIAIAGLLIGLRKATTCPTGALFGLVLAYFIVLHMIGTPLPRYSIPVRPLCYGLALYALQSIWANLRSGTSID